MISVPRYFILLTWHISEQQEPIPQAVRSGLLLFLSVMPKNQKLMESSDIHCHCLWSNCFIVYQHMHCTFKSIHLSLHKDSSLVIIPSLLGSKHFPNLYDQKYKWNICYFVINLFPSNFILTETTCFSKVITTFILLNCAHFTHPLSAIW